MKDRSAVKLAKICVLAIVILSGWGGVARPQSSDEPKDKAMLKIATRVLPPFVMRQDNDLTGFSMDLWRAVATQAGLQYEFVVVRTLSELLDSVKSGKTDAAIAAISVTSQREQQFDFSESMFDSGLQIGIRAGGAESRTIFDTVFSFIQTKEFLALLGLFALLTFIPALIVWWGERKHEDGMVDKDYRSGIVQSLFWATSTLGAQAEQMPRSALGRAMSLLLIYASILFITYFTAVITSTLTVEQIRTEGISSPRDLPGRYVGTVAGSTSAAYLRTSGANLNEFSDISEAYRALDERRVNAVVYDSPVLLYHALNSGKGKLRVVGPVFRRESYAIMFPVGSALRKSVNTALLTLRENGEYEQIYTKWFGAKAD